MRRVICSCIGSMKGKGKASTCGKVDYFVCFHFVNITFHRVMEYVYLEHLASLVCCQEQHETEQKQVDQHNPMNHPPHSRMRPVSATCRLQSTKQ